MSTIANSITPQVKAGAAAVATGSIGVWTVVVPSVIGMIAGTVGIFLSIALAKKALRHIKREDEKWEQERKQSEEMHKLKVKKLLLEIEKPTK